MGHWQKGKGGDSPPLPILVVFVNPEFTWKRHDELCCRIGVCMSLAGSVGPETGPHPASYYIAGTFVGRAGSTHIRNSERGQRLIKSSCTAKFKIGVSPLDTRVSAEIKLHRQSYVEAALISVFINFIWRGEVHTRTVVHSGTLTYQEMATFLLTRVTLLILNFYMYVYKKNTDRVLLFKHEISNDSDK